jgi:hypothetical protein
VSRARSPATEIRYLRTTLRNARTCLLVTLDGSVTDEFKKSFAREQVRAIDQTLAPKKPRHEAYLARLRRTR